MTTIAILLIVGLIGVLWFITIKDIVKGIAYLKAKDEANKANYQSRYNNPKPNRMRLSEISNLHEYPNKKRATNNCNNIPPLCWHKRIIGKEKNLCQPKKNDTTFTNLLTITP
jgi:hypothetical protein